MKNRVRNEVARAVGVHPTRLSRIANGQTPGEFYFEEYAGKVALIQVIGSGQAPGKIRERDRIGRPPNAILQGPIAR